MPLDASACYRALTARDTRFDGVFFVGVSSTGIYCRPVCRARTPLRRNCRFFSNAAAAERSGFRPCLRCRPELAPGASPTEATSALAAQAARRIAAGALNGRGVDELARELEVSSRHLRRAVQLHLGVSPIELATTQRLLLAKRLLHETSLSITQVAYASGFASPRRFNEAFQLRYRLAPGTLRREVRDSPHDGDGPRDVEASPASTPSLDLALAYRPPLHWDALLGFLAARATPGVEHVAGGRYARTVRLDGAMGAFAVRPTPPANGARDVRPALLVTLSPSLLPVLMPLLAALRDMFDLDANPEVIALHLSKAGFGDGVAGSMGVRIPGGIDGFELAARAVLGQQVSVRGATTLMGRFVAAFGEPYAGPDPALARLAPTAARVAQASAGEIAALGMPAARAETLLRLAQAVAGGALLLSPHGDPHRTIAELQSIRGIGEWTAQYVAMRALRWPDAFPASDLVLRRAAGGLTAAQLTRRAEAWRPWRSYAAMALWRSAMAPPPPSTSTRSRTRGTS